VPERQREGSSAALGDALESSNTEEMMLGDPEAHTAESQQREGALPARTTSSLTEALLSPRNGMGSAPDAFVQVKTRSLYCTFL
jgi:hypothetical protein